MDISSLTNLITAFRAETRQNSITPDTLGLLAGQSSSSSSSDGTASSRPFYHIECDAKGEDLILSYPSELTALGYHCVTQRDD